MNLSDDVDVVSGKVVEIAPIVEDVIVEVGEDVAPIVEDVTVGVGEDVAPTVEDVTFGVGEGVDIMLLDDIVEVDITVEDNIS